MNFSKLKSYLILFIAAVFCFDNGKIICMMTLKSKAVDLMAQELLFLERSRFRTLEQLQNYNSLNHFCTQNRINQTLLGKEILDCLNEQKAAYYKISRVDYERINRAISSLLTVTELDILNVHLNTVLTRLNKQLSESDKQRALSYIPFFSNLTRNPASATILALDIISVQEKVDKIAQRKYKENLELTLLRFRSNISSVLHICNSHFTLNDRQQELFEANQIYAEGKFGRKLSKAVRALNGFYCNIDGSFKNTDVETEEVGLEFLKEISTTPENYQSYLDQARKLGYKNAEQYLAHEMSNSCFRRVRRNGKDRFDKQLSPKWLTDWQPIDQSLVLSHPANQRYRKTNSDETPNHIKCSIPRTSHYDAAPAIITTQDYLDKTQANSLYIPLGLRGYLSAKLSESNSSKLYQSSNEYVINYQGQSYDLRQCVGINQANGTVNFLNTHNAAQRETLEAIFENYTVKELEQFGQLIPAIRRLDIYNLKHWNIEEFIHSYRDFEQTRTYYSVNKFITNFINQSNQSQVHELSKVLNDEHLAYHLQNIEKNINPEFGIIALEDKICRIASNSDLLKRLNEKQRSYILSRNQDIETNKTICTYVRDLDISAKSNMTASCAEKLVKIFEQTQEDSNLKTRLAYQGLLPILFQKSSEIGYFAMQNAINTYEQSSKNLAAQYALVKSSGIIEDVIALSYGSSRITSSKDYKALCYNVDSILQKNSGFDREVLNRLSSQTDISRRELFQFCPNQEQNEVYKETIASLQEVAQINDFQARKTLSDFGRAALNLNKKGQTELARNTLSLMQIGKGIVQETLNQAACLGAEFCSFKALKSLGTKKGAQSALRFMAEKSALLSSAPLSIAFKAGQLLWTAYSTYSSGGSLVQDWKEIAQAWHNADGVKLGQTLVRAGCDLLTAKRIVKSTLALRKVSRSCAEEVESQCVNAFNNGQEFQNFLKSPEGIERTAQWKKGIEELKQRYNPEIINKVNRLLGFNKKQRSAMNLSKSYLAPDALQRVEQVVQALPELGTNPERLIRLFNLDLDKSEMQILEDACRLLKDVPNVFHEDGAIVRILRSGCFNESVHGQFYEIKKALELFRSGRQINGLGIKLRGTILENGIPTRVIGEFDILLRDTIIECKNINWPYQIKSLDKDFLKQLQIASEHGKKLEVHSARSIPDCWKKWFDSNGIVYFEDII